MSDTPLWTEHDIARYVKANMPAWDGKFEAAYWAMKHIRDDLLARIAELEAANAELQRRWVPLEDGPPVVEMTEERRSALENLLAWYATVMGNDDDHAAIWKILMQDSTPLARAVANTLYAAASLDGDSTLQQGPTPEAMPSNVRQAINFLCNTSCYTGGKNSPMRKDAMRHADTVSTWLQRQRAQE